MKCEQEIEREIEDLNNQLKDESIKGKLNPVKRAIVQGQLHVLEWVIDE